MTQTLMAEFDEDEPVFPKTDHLLLLGGPKHGETMEVPRDEQVWRIPVMQKAVIDVEPSGIPLLGSGAAEIHTYIRRPVAAGDSDGTIYRRDVLVHESVPNPEIAQQLLMAALFAHFLKSGGRKVIDGVSNG